MARFQKPNRKIPPSSLKRPTASEARQLNRPPASLGRWPGVLMTGQLLLVLLACSPAWARGPSPAAPLQFKRHYSPQANDPRTTHLVVNTLQFVASATETTHLVVNTLQFVASATETTRDSEYSGATESHDGGREDNQQKTEGRHSPPPFHLSSLTFSAIQGFSEIGPWKSETLPETGLDQKFAPFDPKAKESGEPEAASPKQGSIGGDIFYAYGIKGGYLHPTFSLTTAYSDNIRNTKDNRQGDFYAVFSPGLWLTLPADLGNMTRISTSSQAPGGLVMHRKKPKRFTPFSAYLLYGSDLERYASQREENSTRHRLEGSLQYNLRSGLSFDVIEQLIFSQDPRGTGISFELDELRTNLFSTVVDYDFSDSLKLRGDYSSFIVDYKEARNRGRDRQDNAWSGRISQKIRSKTSVFIEYEIIDVDYSVDRQDDSRERNLYTGLTWEITAKSKGSLRLGYGNKDFVAPNAGNNEEYLAEIQAEHIFSSKNRAKVIILRRTNESTITSSDFVTSSSLTTSFTHRFTGKLTGQLGLSYVNDQYDGEVTFGDEKKAMVDQIYRFSPALQYRMRKWLLTDLAYNYTIRDSNFSDLSYNNNLILIRISVIL